MLRPKNKGRLGFRHMRIFNQALLARQVWRLIQFPESLCDRMLKTKYYPDGVLTDTIFTGNDSSSWQAIEHGVELLKKGIIWRIGNGQNIRTWRDPWIPRDFSRRPITPKGNCRYNKISDFITPDGQWNGQMLNDYFLPIDVEEIRKIKLYPNETEDFVAWSPDKKGLFTVKSAYYLD